MVGKSSISAASPGVGESLASASAANLALLPEPSRPSPAALRLRRLSWQSWRVLRFLAVNLRRAVAWATLVFPAAYLAYFFVGGGLLRPEVLQVRYISWVVQAIVTPGLVVYDRLLTHRLLDGHWDLGILGIVVLLLVLRYCLVCRLEDFEGSIKKRYIQAKVAQLPNPGLPRPQEHCGR